MNIPFGVGLGYGSPSCWGWHTYGKWEQYQSGKQTGVTERRQRRVCALCGKEQNEFICYE